MDNCPQENRAGKKNVMPSVAEASRVLRCNHFDYYYMRDASTALSMTF